MVLLAQDGNRLTLGLFYCHCPLWTTLIIFYGLYGLICHKRYLYVGLMVFFFITLKPKIAENLYMLYIVVCLGVGFAYIYMEVILSLKPEPDLC